ncbi:hypothetical protein TNCV_3009501 [Trichonephila clavipes]|nr:hypothetical protein TNCV_3009501 [Trichonephila clavipes]
MGALEWPDKHGSELKNHERDRCQNNSPDPRQDEVVDSASKINFEKDSHGVQRLLDSHKQELTVDELIVLHEQEKDIEELESLDPVQSDDRLTVDNLMEGLRLIEKGLQIFENIDSNEERIF